jgi:hypothetical protein
MARNHKLLIVANSNEDARGLAWTLGRGRDEYTFVRDVDSIRGLDASTVMIVYETAKNRADFREIFEHALASRFIIFGMDRMNRRSRFG